MRSINPYKIRVLARNASNRLNSISPRTSINGGGK